MTIRPYRASRQPAFDLLDLPILDRLFRWRHARTALQIPLLLIAVVMIWDGFTGAAGASENLATVLTWVHYRGLVVLTLLLAGNFFCMACPFMLPRNLARAFFEPARIWPAKLRNKWGAIGLLVLFLFAYEYFDLWATPLWTAWLIVGYFVATLILDSLFRDAPFCKYVCPIGQFNYVASLLSPFEVAARNDSVCTTCATKDCFNGRNEQRGCELWLFLERKAGNLDCTFCLECIHACPYDNVGIRSRLPGREVWIDVARAGVGRFSRRPDLAALVIVFTFGALLNAFGMVSPVYVLEQWLARALRTTSELPVLGLIFIAGLIVEPVLLMGTAGWFTRRLALPGKPFLAVVTRYAFALVPLGFGVWLAHYTFHFFTGVWTVVPVVQTVLARYGVTLLGAPRWNPGPLFPTSWLTPVEAGLIGLGWLGSMVAGYQISEQEAPGRPWRAFLPWAILFTLLAITALWLMNQPMEMRGMPMGG